MTRTATVLALSLLVGCASGLQDDRYPTGSSTLASSHDYDTLYAVNVDEGTVSAVDAETMTKIQEIDVGAEPTRIARVGKDQLWVTLRGERAIAVLVEEKGELRMLETLPAGAEPHGIVASENGKRVYVTYSTADQVVEFDAKSREVRRTFDVQDEPRWLALHPKGDVLFVGSVKNGTVSWIDLLEGEVHPLELPETERLDAEFNTFELTPRVTGDLSVTPDGSELGVPTLYVDNTTSVDVPDDPRVEVSEGYGSSGLGVSRLNPAVVLVPLGSDGRPERPGERSAVFLPTPVFDDAREEFSVFRSYPTSVTAAPNGQEYLVTMEASNAIVAVRNRVTSDRGHGDVMGQADPAPPSTTSTDSDMECCADSMPFTSAFEGGFVQHQVVPITAGAGPRGVAFLGLEQALVHSFLDREVAEVPFAEVHDQLRGRGDSEEVAMTMVDGGEGAMGASPEQVGQAVSLTRSVLPEDVEAGRRLFFSATDGRMAATGAGVSCSTCHFDGRNDGITWRLDGHKRQTPSLAGPVDQTAPVTWGDSVASVADEAMLTSESRMGGDGLAAADAAKIEAYVAWTRYPDVPDLDDALVDLGREVFQREDVGCATCHSGDLYTDNQSHLIIGKLATQTPTLRGIAASAPYFHDGSARDLRGVLTMARGGAMGDTSSLTDHEMDALEAYLRSL